MPDSWRTWALAAVGLCGAAAAGLGISWWLFSGRAAESTATAASPPIETISDCLISRAPCVFETEHGDRIEVRLEPQRLRSSQPFSVSLEVDGYQARPRGIRVRGETIYMGEVDQRFRERGFSGFTADLILPVCTVRAMRWRADLDFFVQGIGMITYSVPFDTVQ